MSIDLSFELARDFLKALAFFFWDLHSFGLTSFPGEGFLFGLKLLKIFSLLGLVSFLIQIINKLSI